MTNLVSYKNEGFEIFIDTTSGESFAGVKAYARMSGKDKSTISRRLKGVDQTTIKTSEALTNGGTQGVRLIPEELIAEWLPKDNPEMATKMMRLGVRMFLHKLAGYEVNSTAMNNGKAGENMVNYSEDSEVLTTLKQISEDVNETNRQIAAQMTAQMAETNKQMAEANKQMAEANKQMAEANKALNQTIAKMIDKLEKPEPFVESVKPTKTEIVEEKVIAEKNLFQIIHEAIACAEKFNLSKSQVLKVATEDLNNRGVLTPTGLVWTSHNLRSYYLRNKNGYNTSPRPQQSKQQPTKSLRSTTKSLRSTRKIDPELLTNGHFDVTKAIAKLKQIQELAGYRKGYVGKNLFKYHQYMNQEDWLMAAKSLGYKPRWAQYQYSAHLVTIQNKT